jgi:hypothetical protein
MLAMDTLLTFRRFANPLEQVPPYRVMTPVNRYYFVSAFEWNVWAVVVAALFVAALIAVVVVPLAMAECRRASRNNVNRVRWRAIGYPLVWASYALRLLMPVFIVVMCAGGFDRGPQTP